MRGDKRNRRNHVISSKGGKISIGTQEKTKAKIRNRWGQAHALDHLFFSPLKIEIKQ
jgi:hypothetical protein